MFEKVVSGAGDNDMRGVWGGIESRGWGCGVVVGIRMLGGRRRITDRDRGRRGGFNSRCCRRSGSGSDREKRHLWTPMRHSLRRWTIKRQMERLKRKDGFNKFNMSPCLDTTRKGFKTHIGTMSRMLCHGIHCLMGFLDG